MKYTIVVKKVIREVVGLITIVLFIYTCTKMRSAATHRRAGGNDTIRANTASVFEWPGQTTGHHPLLPRHSLTGAQNAIQTFFWINNNTTSLYLITGAGAAHTDAGDQVAGIDKTLCN